MVVGCGGIVGSDGSMRERGSEVKNCKRMNILLNKYLEYIN